MKKKTKQKTEFGDWQTPIELARRACFLISRKGLRPASILEPTCGCGAFLIAALDLFLNIKQTVGIDINEAYLKIAKESIGKIDKTTNVQLITEDFFKVNWEKIISSLPEPILLIGNPPWVTNTELMTIGGSNLPKKNNFQNHRGIDAIMGKSNFDISEWMLNQMLERIKNRNATMAMLCKTTVARKVLAHAWRNNYLLKSADIYKIDALKHFGASVDACLFVISTAPDSHTADCHVYNSMEQKTPMATVGLRKKRLVSNVEEFEKNKHLINEEKGKYNWRSGVKHDCSRVMELRKENGLYRNGLGELIELEEDFLYPMLKSSDLANGPVFNFTKVMLVTQQAVGQSTNWIKKAAPKTWRYLNDHAELLNSRASSIYRNRPRFSIFGVGEYSFTPWKVGISGFYKNFNFRTVGPVENKPVVLDDTCYFIGCDSEEDADFLTKLLNSKRTKNFLSTFIFWDAKRPITMDLLDLLDIDMLAKELGQIIEPNKYYRSNNNFVQPMLFD
ncbi:SAM-dependent DNA methyltransferase [Planctomycetota bacterium]